MVNPPYIANQSSNMHNGQNNPSKQVISSNQNKASEYLRQLIDEMCKNISNLTPERLRDYKKGIGRSFWNCTYADVIDKNIERMAVMLTSSKLPTSSRELLLNFLGFLGYKVSELTDDSICKFIEKSLLSSPNTDELFFYLKFIRGIKDVRVLNNRVHNIYISVSLKFKEYFFRLDELRENECLLLFYLYNSLMQFNVYELVKKHVFELHKSKDNIETAYDFLKKDIPEEIPYIRKLAYIFFKTQICMLISNERFNTDCGSKDVASIVLDTYTQILIYSHITYIPIFSDIVNNIQGLNFSPEYIARLKAKLPTLLNFYSKVFELVSYFTLIVKRLYIILQDKDANRSSHEEYHIFVKFATGNLFLDFEGGRHASFGVENFIPYAKEFDDVSSPEFFRANRCFVYSAIEVFLKNLCDLYPSFYNMHLNGLDSFMTFMDSYQKRFDSPIRILTDFIRRRFEFDDERMKQNPAKSLFMIQRFTDHTTVINCIHLFIQILVKCRIMLHRKSLDLQQFSPRITERFHVDFCQYIKIHMIIETSQKGLQDVYMESIFSVLCKCKYYMLINIWDLLIPGLLPLFNCYLFELKCLQHVTGFVDIKVSTSFLQSMFNFVTDQVLKETHSRVSGFLSRYISKLDFKSDEKRARLKNVYVQTIINSCSNYLYAVKQVIFTLNLNSLTDEVLKSVIQVYKLAECFKHQDHKFLIDFVIDLCNRVDGFSVHHYREAFVTFLKGMFDEYFTVLLQRIQAVITSLITNLHYDFHSFFPFLQAIRTNAREELEKNPNILNLYSQLMVHLNTHDENLKKEVFTFLATAPASYDFSSVVNPTLIPKTHNIIFSGDYPVIVDYMRFVNWTVNLSLSYQSSSILLDVIDSLIHYPLSANDWTPGNRLFLVNVLFSLSRYRDSFLESHDAIFSELIKKYEGNVVVMCYLLYYLSHNFPSRCTDFLVEQKKPVHLVEMILESFRTKDALTQLLNEMCIIIDFKHTNHCYISETVVSKLIDYYDKTLFDPLALSLLVGRLILNLYNDNWKSEQRCDLRTNFVELNFLPRNLQRIICFSRDLFINSDVSITPLLKIIVDCDWFFSVLVYSELISACTFTEEISKFVAECLASKQYSYDIEPIKFLGPLFRAFPPLVKGHLDKINELLLGCLPDFVGKMGSKECGEYLVLIASILHPDYGDILRFRKIIPKTIELVSQNSPFFIKCQAQLVLQRFYTYGSKGTPEVSLIEKHIEEKVADFFHIGQGRAGMYSPDSWKELSGSLFAYFTINPKYFIKRIDEHFEFITAKYVNSGFPDDFEFSDTILHICKFVSTGFFVNNLSQDMFNSFADYLVLKILGSLVSLPRASLCETISNFFIFGNLMTVEYVKYCINRSLTQSFDVLSVLSTYSCFEPVQTLIQDHIYETLREFVSANEKLDSVAIFLLRLPKSFTDSIVVDICLKRLRMILTTFANDFVNFSPSLYRIILEYLALNSPKDFVEQIFLVLTSKNNFLISQYRTIFNKGVASERIVFGYFVTTIFNEKIVGHNYEIFLELLASCVKRDTESTQLSIQHLYSHFPPRMYVIYLTILIQYGVEFKKDDIIVYNLYIKAKGTETKLKCLVLWSLMLQSNHFFEMFQAFTGFFFVDCPHEINQISNRLLFPMDIAKEELKNLYNHILEILNERCIKPANLSSIANFLKIIKNNFMRFDNLMKPEEVLELFSSTFEEIAFILRNSLKPNDLRQKFSIFSELCGIINVAHKNSISVIYTDLFRNLSMMLYSFSKSLFNVTVALESMEKFDEFLKNLPVIVRQAANFYYYLAVSYLDTVMKFEKSVQKELDEYSSKLMSGNTMQHPAQRPPQFNKNYRRIVAELREILHSIYVLCYELTVISNNCMRGKQMNSQFQEQIKSTNDFYRTLIDNMNIKGASQHYIVLPVVVSFLLILSLNPGLVDKVGERVRNIYESSKQKPVVQPSPMQQVPTSHLQQPPQQRMVFHMSEDESFIKFFPVLWITSSHQYRTDVIIPKFYDVQISEIRINANLMQYAVVFILENPRDGSTRDLVDRCYECLCQLRQEGFSSSGRSAPNKYFSFLSRFIISVFCMSKPNKHLESVCFDLLSSQVLSMYFFDGISSDIKVRIFKALPKKQFLRPIHRVFKIFKNDVSDVFRELFYAEGNDDRSIISFCENINYNIPFGFFLKKYFPKGDPIRLTAISLSISEDVTRKVYPIVKTCLDTSNFELRFSTGTYNIRHELSVSEWPNNIALTGRDYFYALLEKVKQPLLRFLLRYTVDSQDLSGYVPPIPFDVAKYILRKEEFMVQKAVRTLEFHRSGLSNLIDENRQYLSCDNVRDFLVTNEIGKVLESPLNAGVNLSIRTILAPVDPIVMHSSYESLRLLAKKITGKELNADEGAFSRLLAKSERIYNPNPKVIDQKAILENQSSNLKKMIVALFSLQASIGMNDKIVLSKLDSAIRLDPNSDKLMGILAAFLDNIGDHAESISTSLGTLSEKWSFFFATKIAKDNRLSPFIKNLRTNHHVLLYDTDLIDTSLQLKFKPFMNQVKDSTTSETAEIVKQCRISENCLYDHLGHDNLDPALVSRAEETLNKFNDSVKTKILKISSFRVEYMSPPLSSTSCEGFNAIIFKQRYDGTNFGMKIVTSAGNEILYKITYGESMSPRALVFLSCINRILQKSVPSYHRCLSYDTQQSFEVGNGFYLSLTSSEPVVDTCVLDSLLLASYKQAPDPVNHLSTSNKPVIRESLSRDSKGDYLKYYQTIVRSHGALSGLQLVLNMNTFSPFDMYFNPFSPSFVIRDVSVDNSTEFHKFRLFGSITRLMDEALVYGHFRSSVISVCDALYMHSDKFTLYLKTLLGVSGEDASAKVQNAHNFSSMGDTDKMHEIVNNLISISIDYKGVEYAPWL